ncbi:DUF4301 family protein [Marinoscillum sp.]|uniref:DUF4301 family protein n=1 Tax=Marinoscillum sp. TaxID=2024838 RepID=UPI003BAA0F2B
MFSASDLKQISDHQLTREGITAQIEKFKSGFPPSDLSENIQMGKGLKQLTAEEAEKMITFYENHLEGLEIVKFVPASGAASRMFKSLFAFLMDYKGTDAEYEKMTSDQGSGSIFTFFKKLDQFAFYEDLKAAYQKATGTSLEEAQLKREYTQILDVLLNEPGMNYGGLPKGLLKFHQYPEGPRTPVEEHMVEGAQYAQDGNSNVKIHFTVSPDHMEKFMAHVSEIQSRYESLFGVKIEVSYSIQKPSTDTIAVDMANEPFREDDGSLLFRPAGHGALLENLNDIDADVIFLKNIDNVVPDKIKTETIRYKKVIAGILLDYQQRIRLALTDLDKGEGIEEALNLLENHLGYRPGKDFGGLPDAQKRDFLAQKLDRPLRICGMVKSDGDTGGGPFWVAAKDGSVSLQVVETAQIDLSNEKQKEIFNKSTHFNPVDVVCGVKNKAGKKYNLLDYRDMDTGFITEKSKDGKDLKAQELPGLWNGSMADWNTVFVEVPAITFNPVKSVNDLLKPQHQGG